MGAATSIGRSFSQTSPASTVADSHDDSRQQAIAELDRNGINWREPIKGERFRLPVGFRPPVGPPVGSDPVEVPLSSKASRSKPSRPQAGAATTVADPPIPKSLKERAIQLLKDRPEWPLQSYAVALGCSIRALRQIDRFMSAHSPGWMPRRAPGRRRAPLRVADFVSAVDAVKMSREDVCNVELEWDAFCELVGDRWTIGADALEAQITD